jgi:hypothetical protein
MIPFKNTSSTFSTVSENNPGLDVDVEEQVHPFDPSGAGEGSSRRRQPAVAGIAMLSSGEETPVLRSPRLRLEPDTPDQLPFSLYLPDHSGRVNFENSDCQTNIISSARLERSVEAETDLHELHVSALFDLRSGGDSPRTHSSERVMDPTAHLATEGSRSAQLPERPPLSRSNSTSRAADDSSLVLSARQSEKTRLRGHCSYVASGMVNRMVSTALAQYPHTACPVSSQ